MRHGVRAVLLGRQGSGKGTQAKRLCETLGIPHVSTGDLFRDAIAAATPLGRRVQQIVASGGLVPDDIVRQVVGERLGRFDARHHGFVLDGFPRTTPQAAALLEMLAPRAIDVVVHLDVPERVVIARMLERGRNDDIAGVIKRRLADYEARTRPLLAWFAAHVPVVTVDGLGSVDDVFARVLDGVSPVASDSATA